MKNCNAPENQTTRRILLIACATALAVGFTVSLPEPADADHVTLPPVPSNIQVPAKNKVFLEGHAVGTQDYICLPSGSGFAWTFFGPQATLFNDNDKQVTTHFLSPNPFDNGTPSVTWQHSRGHEHRLGYRDRLLLRPRLRRAGCHSLAPGSGGWTQDGPTGGHTLTATTFIQRLNTSGGVAPSTGCTLSTDVGKKALVPYTADYFFYK